ncbi:MAG TPA: hypothetical protein VGX25_27140 [Actinophytocola sp.]|uniref:hypothetical protein n=1 Tax=Actinophytocola sp. TaxID=1872138 RepID=UPI002DDCB00C|nr:hypothetical protein [Actinophytocola sp.]HEV2783073.1 hypothetical protein [Actinophytocola sp.]
MNRQTTVALAASALTALSMALAASTADADLVTHCIGSGGAVTVPGDLFVPPNESCTLDGTTVTGNVRVAAGADLVVTGGRFNHDVQIDADGYFDARSTTIDGQVTLAPGGFGIFMRDTAAAGVTVQPKGAATIEGFLFLEHVRVSGNVASSVGEVLVDAGSEITGNLGTTGAYYTDVHDSFVDGTLSVAGNATGSVVCGGAVQGAATFSGNGGGVQLGPNGALDSCASGGYWGRNVSIADTTGPIRVDDNIVNGQLQFTANNPVAVVAPTNRIRGGITGDWQPPAAAAALAAPSRERAAPQRIEQRRAGATKSAAKAGKAQL